MGDNILKRKKQLLTAKPGEPLDILAVLRNRTTAWRVRELARLLSLGRRTVYDAIDSGQLSAIRIGTSVRINPSEAAEWIGRGATGLPRKTE